MATGQGWSKTWTFYEGDWHEGNVPIMGVRDHAAWLCSSVFDGARTFEGVSPDLDLHCARVNTSAETMHLKPVVSAETWMGLTARASSGSTRMRHSIFVRCIGPNAADLLVAPDPESTKWCLSLYEAPMRKPEGFSVTLSPLSQAQSECMPVNAKAGCLYPNNARALIEANSRGFGNCVYSTRSATWPNSPRPISSSAKMASCSRRRRTGHSSTASPVNASSSSCAMPA